jgi:hypothetical protein
MLPAASTSPTALASADPGTPPVRGPPEGPATLADDLLEGAEAIGLFMGLPKRAVYRLSTEVSAQFRAPFFKLGSNCLCARKSAILRWISALEAARQPGIAG